MTYKTVLDKTTGELKKVRDGETLPQSPAKAPPPIDITDKAALRELAMKELVAIIQANASDIKAVTAIKELLDRIDGRPHQSIDMNAQVKLRYEPLVIRLANPEPLVIDNETQEP
jgi:hypothetical protein